VAGLRAPGERLPLTRGTYPFSTAHYERKLKANATN
jgi:hypothetical protein